MDNLSKHQTGHQFVWLHRSLPFQHTCKVQCHRQAATEVMVESKTISLRTTRRHLLQYHTHQSSLTGDFDVIQSQLLRPVELITWIREVIIARTSNTLNWSTGGSGQSSKLDVISSQKHMWISNQEFEVIWWWLFTARSAMTWPSIISAWSLRLNPNVPGKSWWLTALNCSKIYNDRTLKESVTWPNPSDKHGHQEFDQPSA